MGSDRRARLSFYALLSGSATRLEVVVTFLAVLELFKLGEIEVVQEGTFADIYLLPAMLQSGSLANSSLD
jgi:segregation and condensation protein A